MKTSSTGQAVRPAKAGQSDRTAQSAAIVTLLWCLMGLLTPRALLYGSLAPFGVSLVAAKSGLPVLTAVIGGYLLGGGADFSLRYMAAAAVIGGARWVLAAMPGLQERAFWPPVLAGASTLLTGILFLRPMGLDAYRVLLLLAESAAAAGAAAVFRVMVQWSEGQSRQRTAAALTIGQQAALLFTGAVAIMAASTLSIHGFAPGRAAAALLVLFLARSGRENGGALAGVIIGGALALADPTQISLSLAIAFGGLLAGLFSRGGRLAEAGVFLIAATALLLTDESDAVLIRLYELFSAGVLFILCPKGLERQLGHLFIQSRELPAVEGLRRAATLRLRVAGRAFSDVADTVAVVSNRLAQHSAPDATAIFRSSSRAVCGACPLHQVCWEQHSKDMMLALEEAAEVLRKDGAVTPEQLTGYPQQSCRQKERLTEYINRSYEQYVVREAAWRRLGEIQSSIQNQFEGMGGLLAGLAAGLEDPQQVDTELSARVLTVCADFGMPVQEALCCRSPGNRLTVDILTEPVGGRLDRGRWLREIQETCGRDLAAPAIARSGELMHITLTERPRYTIETGYTQLCCEGEKLCGDSADQLCVQGCTVWLLSDGMGSGGRAAVDSAMTVGLTARLWQAGFSPDSILQTVNAALLVKSREESLATLDVAAVDPFSGRLDCYKAGAAPTLLRSGGRVSRLERPSLPIGILPSIQFEHCHDWLIEGDILLMMSDGAIGDSLAAVEELLRGHPEGADMQTLSRQVAEAARQAQSSHQDDITVIAMQLHRACTADET